MKTLKQNLRFALCLVTALVCFVIVTGDSDTMALARFALLKVTALAVMIVAAGLACIYCPDWLIERINKTKE